MNTARIGDSLLAGSFEAKPLHDPGRYVCQWFKSSDLTFINGPGDVTASPTVISQANNVSVRDPHALNSMERRDGKKFGFVTKNFSGTPGAGRGP